MVRASPHQGARTMAEAREAFIGIDAAKLRNAVAIADAGRDGEVRFLGEVDASPEGMRRLAARLAAKYDRLHFCYEAGPTGYGLHRLLTGLGHHCTVVAPSLIPRRPGDRVKTNRRDALTLARLLRAGELTPVWVPDEGHEAIRDLVRARAAAVETLRVHKQQVSAFMLKHGRHFPRKKAWGARYLRWLQEQRFEHPAHQIVLQEAVEAVRLAKERVERLERTIEEFVAGLVARPGRPRPAGPARRRPDRRRHLRDRDRRPAALREPPAVDGLSRPGAERALDRRQRPARRHHQGGQRPGPPHARRERLDLPPSAARRGEEAGTAGARAAQGPRDCLEGAEPAERAVPGAGRPRQAADRRLHRDRPRARRLHVGGGPGGADRLTLPARAGGWGTSLAHGRGRGRGRGNSRRRFVAGRRGRRPR